MLRMRLEGGGTRQRRSVPSSRAPVATNTSSHSGETCDDKDTCLELDTCIRTMSSNFPMTVSTSSTSAFSQSKKDDDHSTVFTDVESQLLPFIDEEKPLPTMCHISSDTSVGSVFSKGSIGVSVRSNSSLVSKNTNSSTVFTDKKQDDLDRLFDDLLGGNMDQQSLASTAMSSIMPAIKTHSMIRSRNGAGSSVSVVTDDVSVPGDPYVSNQYIFNNRRKFAEQKLQETKSIKDRYAKFYKSRKNRMLHIRAGLTFFFLVAIIFTAMQLTSTVSNDREQLKSLRDEYRYNGAVKAATYNHEQGEMMDRPMPLKLINDLIKRPNGIPLQDNNNNLPDGITKSITSSTNKLPPPPNQLLTKDAFKGSPSKTKNGPVDTLPKIIIDKKDPVEETPSLLNSLEHLSNLKLSDPHHNDFPFLWQIPQSGAGTLRHIISECLGVTLAAEQGSSGAYANDENLEVFKVGKAAKFVNADTTYLPGIKKAATQKLLDSNLVNVIVSPYVHQISTMLFSPEHHGRMTTIIRHPIERAASSYAQMRTINPEVGQLSLAQYATSKHIENNWMVRYLSDSMSGEIKEEHLVQAKEVLRTKCLIGLVDKMWASMKRFEHYFNWRYDTDPTNQFECRKQALLDDVDRKTHKAPTVEEGSYEWTLLLWQNKYDMKLFKYAEQLFDEQKDLFPKGAIPE